LILSRVRDGVQLREAQHLTSEIIETNLPKGVVLLQWKTVSTCAKNWHQYMNGFGRAVGASFFQEEDVTQEFPRGTAWTHKAFGTDMTEREMDVLIELVQLVLPGVEEIFSDTALDQLANDLQNGHLQPAFRIMPFEAGPQGIQHTLLLSANHPIINWKRCKDPNAWARAFPLAADNEIKEVTPDLNELEAGSPGANLEVNDSARVSGDAGGAVIAANIGAAEM